MPAMPFPTWVDSNFRLRHEAAVPIPCRCLRWHYDPREHPTGAYGALQRMPDCVLHRATLSPAAIAWLEAEIAAAKAYAELAPEAAPYGWRQYLSERLARDTFHRVRETQDRIRRRYLREDQPA